jgi:16S rRNA (cytosine967-C5)-methyltransferase
MNSELVKVALGIIAGSSRQQPADAVLREELASRYGISQGDKRQLSRAVFSYFRWLGWLAEGSASAAGLRQAMSLADRYERAPDSFSEVELLARAVPGWLGKELPLTAEWVRGLQSEPKLWLRARPGQGPGLARSLGHCRAYGEGRYSDTLEYLGREDLFTSAEFHQGRFELQDLGSQAVGWICAPVPGETWWDTCAGEGGKTLHLSELMANRGLVWASDRAPWRLQRLKRRAARARVFNYRSVVWSGHAKPPTKTKFDGVLLDAPCSGVGTWHRNPHARWTTTPEDVKELGVLQQHLLGAAATAVKLGGRLFYAVCTLTRTETEEVATAFERGAPDFERLSLVNPLTPKRPAAGHVQIWPGEFGSNGMFIAGWRRSLQEPAEKPASAGH